MMLERTAREIVTACRHVASPTWLGVPVEPGACVACIAAAFQTAVAEEREACARMADAIVKEHRDRQREVYGNEHEDANDDVVRVHVDTTIEGGRHIRCGEPGYFCEDFGCGSFEEFAAAIRARTP